jgi:hypothetical protein
VSVVRDHEDLLVIATDGGQVVVVEHQLVMDEGRTGRDMVIAIRDPSGTQWPHALTAADAIALRDWITARLKSGAIR